MTEIIKSILSFFFFLAFKFDFTVERTISGNSSLRKKWK